MSSTRFVARVAAFVISLVAASGVFGQSSLQPLRVVPHRVLPVLADLKPIRLTGRDVVLHLAVGLQPAHRQELEEFCDAVSDPASPEYRHFTAPEEVGIRFGASKTDVDAVTDYLRQFGMNIQLVALNRMEILADATVAQAEAAFHTTVCDFQAANPVGPGTIAFHANITQALTPASVASVIIDVSGLETYTRPIPAASTTLLTPSLTRGLYNSVPLYTTGYAGTGRTVAVSNWDGYRLSNLPLLYATFGLPIPPGGVASNVTIVKIDGGAGTGPEGVEGDIDMQMELSMAPLANLIVYDGSNGDVINVYTREANDNLADCISESWGWIMDDWEAEACHNQHLAMSAQGITYMACSGDSGTNWAMDWPYPDCEPEVLAVGGTVATVDSTSGLRQSEVGWGGSGGGWSTIGWSFNKLPSWQCGTGVPTTHNFRLSPDVAIHASGNGGGAYLFYYAGKLNSGYVGTSFSSPIMAGSLAVCEQRIISLGGLPPDASGNRRFGRIMNLFYSQNGRTDVWHDITSGNNGTLPDGTTSNCTAKWDFVTGWGAPDFNALVASQATVGTAPTSLSMGNISGAIGQTVAPSAVLARTSDSAPLSGELVGFSANGNVIPPGTTDSSGLAATGFAIPEAMGLGTFPIAAAFGGDATYGPSTAGATLTVGKADTDLSVTEQQVVLGQAITLTATLTRTTDNAPLGFKRVSFTIDGVSAGSGLTYATNGVASVNYVVPDSLTPGAHAVQASFGGSTLYNASTGTGTLTVIKGDTTTTPNENSGSYGQTVTLTASLIRNVDSVVVSGRTVTFSVGGAVVGSGTTNASGTATASYVISGSLPPGTNTISASFAGDTVYNASSGTAALTVSKSNTTSTPNNASGVRGQTIAMTAVVRRTTDSGVLSGEAVAFTVDGNSIGSATTDGAGIASLTYVVPASLSVGSHSIVASFGGDTQYNASTGSALLQVTIPPEVTGNVTLDLYLGGAGIIGTLEYRTPGTMHAIYTSRITLDAAGNYTDTTAPPGTYDIACKFPNWLRQVVTSATITSSGGSASFSLTNGDADGSNVVDLLDLSIVLANFGFAGTPPQDGDLTWDGTVDLLDLSAVLASFGARGDP